VGLYSSKKVKIYAEKLKQIIPKEELEGNQIKWLDVGAGFGELIQAVRKISNPYLDIRGIEPCEPKVKRAQSKGIPVEYGNLTDINETFSHISLIDIYSHLPNPIESLVGIKRLLKEEGKLILVTGNGGDITRNEYPGSLYLPDHLSFAGEGNLYTVLKEAGYEITSLIKSPYKPIDNPIICFIKNITRKMLKKPTLPIKSSKTSRFRSLWIYARVKNTVKSR
jgi:SAM-dependent methyltransferase